MRRGILIGVVGLVACLGWVAQGAACPFCTAVAQTFSEEMSSKQVVVLATLEEAPPEEPSNDPDAPLPKAKFKVTQVLKGEEWVTAESIIEVLYFGEPNRNRPYLIMAVDPPILMWSSPLGLSEQARDYILKLPSLAADASRLEFFQDFLECEDEMLARDAYDEFAKTPYAGVVALKDKMQHDRLIAWIKDADIPASRRRLYFTMLGVCGKPEDAPLLADLMRSTDRKQKAGLDALLACYLLITKDAGLSEVDQLFLANPEAEYADTYAAIMAIRFHGTETNVIDKSRLVKSLRHLLNRPELADLVIPDLARWQDWEVMPRMVQLFKDADEKSSWVRVPVINYLRSCPLPEAQKWIEELSKIDPEAVKRAQTFFPFDATGTGGEAAQPQPQPEKSSGQPAAATGLVGAEPAPPSVLADAATDPAGANGAAGSNATADSSGAAEASGLATAPPVAHDTTARDRTADLKRAAATTPRTSDAAAALSRRSSDSPTPTWIPNRMALWGVPIGAGVVLMYTLRCVLGVPWRGLAG